MTSRLELMAYGMLGSIAEAQEVAQEARLRLHQLASPPDSEDAFLFRVASNLCIDRLRRAKTEREAYFGPWLPEPLQADHAQEIELAQELTIGLLHLLERLPPNERIVYVLREAFDYSFEELAQILDVSAQSARQRAHRARKRLHAQPKVQAFPDAACKATLEKLVGLVATGDVEGIVSILSDDVVAYSDGGGVVSAAIRPVHGPHRIAKVLLHLAQQAQEQSPLDMQLERLNGSWCLVIKQSGEIHSVHFIAGSDGVIHQLYSLRNPHKLAHLNF